MKEKVRPIYNELKSFFSQIPPGNGVTPDLSIKKFLDEIIGKLNNITGKDYSRFKIEATNMNPNRWAGIGIVTISYPSVRIKVSSLLSCLHSEYFSDEAEPSFSTVPISTAPSMIITQQQSQNQSAYIQIILEVQSKIDEKLREYNDGSKEKTFLEKIKSSLSGARSILELIRLILNTAAGIGLTIEQVMKLFS